MFQIAIAVLTGLAPALGAQAPGPPATLLTLDLPAAIERARAFSPLYQQANTATGIAREERVQAKAALFPTINALNQYIFTQPNGTPSGVFVANDGVHVYNEQATVHAELFSFVRLAEYQRSLAAEAAARARRDVASRGLIAIVVQNYYSLIIAQRHEVNARRSLAEARNFFEITRKQEQGGEVAKADVIKAQLQLQQRERDLLDEQTAILKAKIALGVMLFQDLAQPFAIVDDLKPDLMLEPMSDLTPLALSTSPDIRAAELGVRESEATVRAARGAYYPSLVVDYFWGINANSFAAHGFEDRQNLGSSVVGTVTVPVWNWGAIQSRVRQAQLVKQQAGYDLTFAQRGLQSALNTLYLEAQTAKAQLESLRGSLDLATESLRLTVLRYQAGEATALEVADAQSTLALARNAYDDGLARYRVALAGLQILTGRF